MRRNSKKSALATTNTTLNGKSKSLSKFPPILDKEEIFREFSAFNNSRSTNKLIKEKSNPNLDRSLSNASKGKLSKGSNLIPIKTIKVKTDSSKKINNISQGDFTKSKEKFYAVESYKRKEKELDLANLNNSITTIETAKKLKKKPNLQINPNKEFESKSDLKSRQKNNVDIYNLYKVCYDSTENSNNNDFFTTVKNTIDKEKEKSEKGKNEKMRIDENLEVLSYENSRSPNIPKNDNYEKYFQHLLEQITFLNFKISEYKTEKDKLLRQLDESKSDKSVYIEKLEKEIKSYKNMVDSCVKTCSQLAEELMMLRKEIDKYSSLNSVNQNNSNLNNLSHTTNKSGSNSRKINSAKIPRSASSISPIKKVK